MKKYISTLLCLIAAMIWGFGFTAQKAAVELSVFTLGASRNLFATIFLLAVIPMFDKMNKKLGNERKDKQFFTKTELIGGTVCGIILTVAAAFQQSGIGDGTDAGKAAFITALYVVLVPVMSLVFGKKTPFNVWLSVGIAALGFYLLCIKGDFTIEPSDGLVLMCALVFAGHIIAIDRYSPRCDGVRMSCIQFFVSFLLNLVMALILEGPISFGVIGSVLPSILFLGICSSGIGFTLQILAQKDGDPTVVSVVMSLESVFGVLGGVIFFGEAMSPKEYIGCAIVFAAVILSQIDFKKTGKA